MKKFLIILLFFTLSAFANEAKDSAPIQLSAQYNEATARIEAFKNIDFKLDKDLFKDYLKDINKKENLEAIKNKTLIIGQNRQLCPFYLKETLVSYAVTYFNKPEMTFYYNILGSLIKIEISKGDSYPKKSLGYSRFQNLVSVTFEVSDKEQFIYDKDGKLIAHWVDNKITNESKDDRILNKFGFQRGLRE